MFVRHLPPSSETKQAISKDENRPPHVSWGLTGEERGGLVKRLLCIANPLHISLQGAARPALVLTDLFIFITYPPVSELPSSDFSSDLSYLKQLSRPQLI